MFENVYLNKTVLITGHTGFKGTWLTVFLQKLGAGVVGFSLDPETDPNHFSLLNSDIRSKIGDIRDKKRLEQLIEKYKPDIVFHLAAQALVRKSYTNPLETLEVNIMGTANLFEACRDKEYIKAIVNITSDKCYENKEVKRPYAENDVLGGYDMYSSSKACSELITNSFRSSFFNPDEYNKRHNVLIASMRAGNVIGGGDWAEDRIIPDIIRSIQKSEKLMVRNPYSTRPWQHVLEPLSAYLLIGQKLLQGKTEFARAWNVSEISNEMHSVQELVDKIKEKWDKFEYSGGSGSNLHEANTLLLDSWALNEQTGWKNIWGFDETLDKTIQWYKKYYEEGIVLTNNQLGEYIDDAKTTNAVWIK